MHFSAVCLGRCGYGSYNLMPRCELEIHIYGFARCFSLWISVGLSACQTSRHSIDKSGLGFGSLDCRTLKHWAVDTLGRGHIGLWTHWAVDTLGRGCIGLWTHWAVDTLGRGHIGPRTHWAVDTLGPGYIGSWIHWAVDTLGPGHIGPWTH